MTIGKKLTTSFVVIVLAVAGLAGSGLYSIGKLSGLLDVATNRTASKVYLLAQVQANIYKMRSCEEALLLFSTQVLPEKIQETKQDFAAKSSNVAQLLKEVKPLLVTDEGKTNVDFMASELPSLAADFEKETSAGLSGNTKQALSIYNERSAKSLYALEQASEDLSDSQRQLLRDASAAGAKSAMTARWTAWILLLTSIGLAAAAFFTVQRASKQLRGVTADLAEGASQIASASSQVASSSQALAQGASEQAASLEETSASAEEITAMTRKNAENSQSAAGMMAEVDQHVGEGNRTLEQMVESMTEITSSSQKISKIIKVIDEIAFQTNILALNAAVEAARAGEAGMGFAVVADEVRSLAQRSAQAAKDTAALIEESITKSNEGSSKLQQVTEVIQAVTESAAKVKTLVDEVNLGSQEQARGIEQISKAIVQMDQVTQSTAASAEQSASASEEMTAQSDALKNIVRQLHTLVGGEDQA